MTQIRNRSLRCAVRREYEKARRAGLTVTDRELLRRAITAPVEEGYFVGVAHAVKMVRKVRNGKISAGMSAIRREMWEEIAAKVAARQGQFKESLVDSVCRVLDSATASRFFISEASAIKLLKS